MKSPALLLSLALFAGCSGPAAVGGRDATAATPSAASQPQAVPSVPNARTPAAASLETAASAEPAPRRLRGHAVLGKDGYGLTPCGDTRQRIVEFSVDAQTLLDKFLAGGAREFFLDGWAVPGPGEHLRISRLERIYSEGPGCEEPLSGVLFIARGNEPFWALSVGQDGVRLQRPGEPTITAPLTAPIEEAGERRLEVPTSAGKLSVRLTPGACSDGMSDTLYGWQAQVSLGAQTFSGCGFSGLPADRD